MPYSLCGRIRPSIQLYQAAPESIDTDTAQRHINARPNTTHAINQGTANHPPKPLAHIYQAWLSPRIHQHGHRTSTRTPHINTDTEHQHGATSHKRTAKHDTRHKPTHGELDQAVCGLAYRLGWFQACNRVVDLGRANAVRLGYIDRQFKPQCMKQFIKGFKFRLSFAIQ